MLKNDFEKKKVIWFLCNPADQLTNQKTDTGEKVNFFGGGKERSTIKLFYHHPS